MREDNLSSHPSGSKPNWRSAGVEERDDWYFYIVFIILDCYILMQYGSTGVTAQFPVLARLCALTIQSKNEKNRGENKWWNLGSYYYLSLLLPFYIILI